MAASLLNLARQLSFALVLLSLALPGFGATTSFQGDPEYVIDTLDSDDGPPEYTATAMAQTADGYLWFGTFGGLLRFDGERFISLDPDNTPQLPSAAIPNLHVDRRGWLWLSTYRGLVARNGAQWRTFGPKEGWVGDMVRTFAERTNGDLLITTFDGHVLEFANDQLRALPNPPGESGQGYLAHIDEAGRWWVVQNQFIGQWDGQRWVSQVTLNEFGSDSVGCGPARDGGLWLLLSKELRKYRNGEEVLSHKFARRPGGFWALSEDSRGNVWVCTYDQGLYRVTPDGTERRWTHTNGLPSDGVRFVYEDRESNLWVGCGPGGVTRFKPRRVVSFGREQGLGAAANSVWADKTGTVLAGTYGASVFQWNGTSFTNISIPGTNPPPYLHSVLRDRSGRLWLGAFERGLWLLENGSVRSLPFEQTGGNNIIALFEDSRGHIWISGGGGLSVFDGTRFRTFGREHGLPPRRAILSFNEDKQGAIWLSNGSEVFRYKDECFVEVRSSEGTSLSGITCFVTDDDGTVWLGSQERGLLRWRQERLATVDKQSGFPVTDLAGIIADNNGFIWMTSGLGIIRVARTNLNAVADGSTLPLTYQVLDRGDGLSSLAFPGGHQPTCARDAAGRLWFATGKGVAMIDPKNFRLNSSPPDVHIESVSYRRAPGSRRPGAAIAARETQPAEVNVPLPLASPLQLSPGSHQLEIHYSGTSFSAPEKVQFQVKLEGHDQNWVDVANRRVAYFYELAPGDYTFRVRAANNDRVWNEAGTTFAFSVLPFFWQTVWFRGVMGFAVFGEAGLILALLANRRRLNRAQTELRESEQRVKLATDAARLGIWIWEIPRDEIWMSTEGRSLFAWGETEAIDFDRFIRRLHPQDREPIRQAVERALKGEGDYEAEYRIIRDTGEMRWIAARGQVEFDATNKPVRMRGVSIDITERKQTESDAQRQRAELAHVARVSTMGELAASVAHELNQPLGAILSNAEAAELVLNNEPPALDEIREILADIRKDDERAGEVIRRMRALLRKREMELQPLDMNSVVEDVFRLISADAALRKTVLTAELSPRLPPVYGDRIHLQQVLLNLTMNAMEAMSGQAPDKRRLLVHTSFNGNGLVEMAVTDSGTGIEPDKLPHLFEPFYTTKPNGMGMGLCIARRIVEAHHGRIRAETNAAGGATFHVTLPAALTGT